MSGLVAGSSFLQSKRVPHATIDASDHTNLKATNLVFGCRLLSTIRLAGHPLHCPSRFVSNAQIKNIYLHLLGFNCSFNSLSCVLLVLSATQSTLQVFSKMLPIKLLAKGVTGAYGLAREAMADPPDKKGSGHSQLEVPSYAKDQNGSSDDASSVSSSDGGEEAQELDEVQQKFAGGHRNQELMEAKDIDGVFNALAKQYPPPGYTEVAGKLDLPVILPQRRPKNKERGFVYAYAPVLQTCGIGQAEFLAFLDGFEKAIQVCQIFELFFDAF